MSLLGKRLAKKKRGVAEVQMAPMIDMVFLLLVFFMCVSSISQAGLLVELDLPESAASETPDELSGRVTISVTAEGVYWGGELLTEGELELRLEEMSAEVQGAKLLIRADREVRYSKIRDVMKAAADIGMSDYIYATHQM
ncbi:MAG: biopolymer transporter ExbD [Verrucomicrobiota bacterium]